MNEPTEPEDLDSRLIEVLDNLDIEMASSSPSGAGKAKLKAVAQLKAAFAEDLEKSLPEKVTDANPHDMFSRGKAIGKNQTLDSVKAKLGDLLRRVEVEAQIKRLEAFLLAWSGDMSPEPLDSMRFQVKELKALKAKEGKD